MSYTIALPCYKGKKAQNCEVVVNILLQEKKWKLRKVTVLLRQAHGETAGQD